MPGILDHVIIAVLIAGIPLTGVAQRRELVRTLTEGLPDAKRKAYRTVIIKQWSAAAVLAAYWWFTNRSFDALGLRVPTASGLLISAVVAGAVIAVLSLQVRSVRARAEVAEQVRKQTSSLSFMLPRSREELDLFSRLGVTAGIVEEFICRGYMLWYFASFMNWWLALVVSSLIFGIGHVYQGASGVAKTTAVGLILGALYRASGALWASMIVHAAIDVLSGRAVYFAYQHEPPAQQPDAA